MTQRLYGHVMTVMLFIPGQEQKQQLWSFEGWSLKGLTSPRSRLIHPRASSLRFLYEPRTPVPHFADGAESCLLYLTFKEMATHIRLESEHCRKVVPGGGRKATSPGFTSSLSC